MVYLGQKELNYLISLANLLFVQKLIQANSKKNTKDLHYCPYVDLLSRTIFSEIQIQI